MRWIRSAGHQQLDAPEAEEIPEISDLDQLQTAVLLSFNSKIFFRRSRECDRSPINFLVNLVGGGNYLLPPAQEALFVQTGLFPPCRLT